MYRLSVCLILVILQFVCKVKTNYATCVTPDNVVGNCVPIEQCQRITWILRSLQRPYPANVADYLRRSHCATYGNRYFACCAAYDIVQPWYQSAFAPGEMYQTYTAPTGEQIINSMPCGSYSNFRIANGEVVELSEYPWMALLQYAGQKTRQRFLCAGTLITDRYVLTAAHCVDGQNELASVRLGEHNLNTEHDCENSKHNKRNFYCAPDVLDVGIELILPHPQYQAKPLMNDIALIRLAYSVQFQSHIKPICLPRFNNQFNVFPENFIIAGWGVTERGYASDVLKKAVIPLQSHDVCQRTFQRSVFMGPEFLCAGAGPTNRISCRGDSGGPLFAAVNYLNNNIRYVQYGIISAGVSSCGNHNYPGVYTNIHSYMTWIANNIQF